MKIYRKVIDPVFSLTRFITLVLITVMVAVESYEIAMREFTGDTPSWSKELVLLCMVWMGCLGSAVLHREGGHITLEFLVDRMGPGVRRVIMASVELLVLVFSLFLLGSGAVLVSEFMDQTLPGTRMPAGASYLPLAAAGLLLALTSIERLFDPAMREAREPGDAG